MQSGRQVDDGSPNIAGYTFQTLARTQDDLQERAAEALVSVIFRQG